MPATALRGTPARGAARTVRSDGASARPGCGPPSRWTGGRRCGKLLDHGRGSRSNGSSGSRMRVSPHRAQATAAICCPLPDRRSASASIRPARCGKCSGISSSSRCVPLRVRRGSRPSHRLARERPLPCGTQPTPARAIAADGRPAITSPSSATAAELAGVFPIRALNGAVFPARLRPGILRISPCRTSKLTSCGVWHSREGR